MKKAQDEIKNKIQTIIDEDDSPKVLKQKFNADTLKGIAMFMNPKTTSVTLDDGITNKRHNYCSYVIIIKRI